ncbi:MAG: DUF362 domain-containing protein [Actinobacteria bacterium]|nr:DUF362 domain-containing protein [Actinomycetota bacterium]
MAKVYFSSIHGRQKSRLESVERLFDKAGFADLIDEDDLVAIKVHFGERGNTAFLSPLYVRRVVDKVKAAGGRPFLTDGNTLYKGSRSNAVDHLTTAIENGFSYATVGAPLLISDGLNGHDYLEVEIGGKHFDRVKIGSAIREADAIIAVSHFKGHEATGFGGAIKNVGMGCGSRAAKQLMHSDLLPTVDSGVCSACERCVGWCPAEAISVRSAAAIDYDKCLGCGECTVSCPKGAIAINWKTEPQAIQEKVAEYALGAIKDKGGKVGFVNFVIDVVPDCDCWSWNDAPIAPDIGIAASTDIVAIDQASVDLVNSTEGIKGGRLTDPYSKDKFGELSGIDWTSQLAHAERIGLGKRKYELVRVG